MPDQPEQKITPVTKADEQKLREQRATVEKYLSNDKSRESYQTPAGKLGTIRALQAKIFKAGQRYELECLGVVLGDAFVQEMGFEWVAVEDDYGRDLAVKIPNSSIIVFPLTMISKRLERGEEVDVFDLFNGVAAHVEKLQKQGM